MSEELVTKVNQMAMSQMKAKDPQPMMDREVYTLRDFVRAVSLYVSIDQRHEIITQTALFAAVRRSEQRGKAPHAGPFFIVEGWKTVRYVAGPVAEWLDASKLCELLEDTATDGQMYGLTTKWPLDEDSVVHHG